MGESKVGTSNDVELLTMIRNLPDQSTTPVKQYFREIRKIQMLSAEEELKLARKVVQGDETAREKMINSNLRLVVSVAKRYLNCGLPLSDMIEEGNLGLIKAVERFRPEMGYRFSTYAAWWIRQSIVRAIAKNSRLVRLPVNVAEVISRFFRVLQEMMHRIGREPSYGEIAEEMKLTVDQVGHIMELSQYPLSLEYEIGEKEGNSLVDVMEDPQAVSPVEQICGRRRKEMISYLLELLTQQERSIISHRFGLEDGEPKTLEDIGQMQGLTRERIRQIEDAALRKLRRHLSREDVSLSELL